MPTEVDQLDRTYRVFSYRCDGTCGGWLRRFIWHAAVEVAGEAVDRTIKTTSLSLWRARSRALSQAEFQFQQAHFDQALQEQSDHQRLRPLI